MGNNSCASRDATSTNSRTKQNVVFSLKSSQKLEARSKSTIYETIEKKLSRYPSSADLKVSSAGSRESKSIPFSRVVVGNPNISSNIPGEGALKTNVVVAASSFNAAPFSSVFQGLGLIEAEEVGQRTHIVQQEYAEREWLLIYGERSRLKLFAQDALRKLIVLEARTRAMLVTEEVDDFFSTTQWISKSLVSLKLDETVSATLRLQHVTRPLLENSLQNGKLLAITNYGASREAGDDKYNPLADLKLQIEQLLKKEEVERGILEFDEVSGWTSINSQLVDNEEEELRKRIARQEGLLDFSKKKFKSKKTVIV